MAEPRVRACHPPRMAVHIDGHEHLLPTSDRQGARIDLFYECPDHEGGWRIATKFGVPSHALPPEVPVVDEAYRPLAAVLVQACAVAVHQCDITPCIPPLVPLEDDWVSTLRPLPPGGVQPGEEPVHDRVADSPAVALGVSEAATQFRRASVAAGWLARAFLRIGGDR